LQDSQNPETILPSNKKPINKSRIFPQFSAIGAGDLIYTVKVIKKIWSNRVFVGYSIRTRGGRGEGAVVKDVKATQQIVTQKNSYYVICLGF
jgi:hypothetical protein